MKKTIAVLLMVMLLTALMTVGVYAVGNQTGNNQAYFTDADGDGVCDNFANGTGRRGGNGSGNGASFVDADGDGVCDNFANGTGRCGGNGSGSSTGFVDADGDGVCDVGGGTGRGMHCGRNK